MLTCHIVIDAANVVGARPNGWWKDRAGATLRLAAAVGALRDDDVWRAASTGRPNVQAGEPLPAHVRWHVVVEGAARDIRDVSPVTLYRAQKIGDEMIASVSSQLARELSPDWLVVVTNDRELKTRLPSSAEVVGATWLWSLIDAAGSYKESQAAHPS